MPLLAKKVFPCVKSLTDVKPDEKVFTIPHTKEQFRSKANYEKRYHLYKSRIWTCQSTGHVNLTHEEAWNSEKAVLKSLKAGFSPCYDKPVLELVHHNALPLDSLVDQAWMLLQQVLSIDERVTLKVKSSGGKSLKAEVVRVDSAGVQGNPTSNCSSPSSDKENDKEENSASKKWVPPKLLQYRYSIRLEGEDSVIHSVPATDLGRCDKPPSKELLRLFIRTYAIRAGQAATSPWVVDEAQIKKFSLSSKVASFVLPSTKWKSDEIARRIEEESKSMSPGKNSSRIKVKTDAKENKRKRAAEDSISKLKAKSMKKSEEHKHVIELSSDTDSDNDSSDSDVPLSVVKTQLTPKKKTEGSFSTPTKSSKSLTPKSKGSSSSSKKSSVLKQSSSSKKKDSKEKKKKEKDGKKKCKKEKEGKEGKSKEKKKRDKVKKKGKEDPKQLTLFDMTKKKSLKTPEKKLRSPEKKMRTPSKSQKTPEKKKSASPQKIPAIVLKLQNALKKDNKKAVKLFSRQAASILNSHQRARLPANVKDLVMKNYAEQQEKRKMSLMSEAERKQYLKKKRSLSCQIREDTDLDLELLPDPKQVPTPDNMPNETFGDVIMVTEFISCFSGLLMPGDEFPVYTDLLMKALSEGKDGFEYLSHVVRILLQTLLQDQLAADYQELDVPLSDIPVNPCTASELIRLCLRGQDVSDVKSDYSNISHDDTDEEEVPDELIQLLETTELYQLEPNQKLTILKGLCTRILGTYSVQDYITERQQESAKNWKAKMAIDRKTKKKDEPETKDAPKAEEQKPSDDKQTSIKSFYGNQGENKQQSSAENSEANNQEDEQTSGNRRRRVTTAQAATERIKREREERLRRNEGNELFKKQREKELIDEKAREAIRLCRVTMRQSPVGYDRNHSRYWIFSDVTPGIYLEKGWVTNDIDYSVPRPDAADSDDSSSDDEEEETDAGANKKPTKAKKCSDKTFPRVSQNLWFTYDSVKDVDTLIEKLGINGVRENCLKRELKKRYNDICKDLNKVRSVKMEREYGDGDVEMIGKMKSELFETEMRLRNGGLGGVMDFQTWQTKLESSIQIKAVTECMLETHSQIMDKFRDGIMSPTKKKVIVKEETKQSGEEDEEVEMPEGTANWREAVRTCPTFSRLHVLLGILDSSVKWEKSAENAKCKICRKKGDDDRLLLCDDCNQAFHMYCLRPAITDVPLDDWHCAACAPQYRKRVPVKPNYRPRNSDGEDEEEVEKEEIDHDTTCKECGGDENLISCDSCPSVYHTECHFPPLRRPPRGSWTCYPCKTGTKSTKTRAGVTKKNGKTRKAAKQKRSYSSESESESEMSDDSDPSFKAQAPVKQKRPTKKQKTKRAPASPDVSYDICPRTNRRAPSELSMAEEVINEMLKYKNAWPFHTAVNKKEVPDYFQIIKQPIDFQRIKDKLNCLVYGSPQEVIDDVSLLFRNAAEYNKTGTDIYECMEESEKHFVGLLKKHLPFYVYNRDLRANGYGDHMYNSSGKLSRRIK